MLPNFFFNAGALNYDFGPGHPLKPERLRCTLTLLERLGRLDTIDSGAGDEADVLRVHSENYVDAVALISRGGGHEARGRYGFGSTDNPPFARMYEASLAYCGASARAARAARDGASLAYGIAGGLHHAVRDKASGFCIFNDAAIASHILLARFAKVAYVDIDVHHGDGVQWIFYDEPRVLTCSIHEEGRTLFPGTGWIDETGTEFSSLNVPLQAGTTGDVWLQAFGATILPAIERFQPGAVVLQMGTDTHALDPLAHIRNTQQEWLEAVTGVRDLGLPIVALGGGGYNLTTVPRMWASACLALAEVPFDDAVPGDLAEAWDVPTISDPVLPEPRQSGRSHAESIIDALRAHHRLLNPATDYHVS